MEEPSRTPTLSKELIAELVEKHPSWITRHIIHSFQDNPDEKLIQPLAEATTRWLLQLDHDDLLQKIAHQNIEDDTKIHETRLRELIQENHLIAEPTAAKWFSSLVEIKWEAYNQIYHHNHTQDGSASDEGVEEENWGELDPIQELVPPFASFYGSNLDQLALSFAAQLELDRLRRLVETGELELDPIQIFDGIPLHARTSDLEYGQHLIALLPRPANTPTKPTHPTRNLLRAIFEPTKHQSLATGFTDQQLTDWYLARVEAIDQFTGCVDAAIEIVQHGAASGVTGLESVAEDLSLLSKLIYDVHPTSMSLECWTLNEWRSKSPDQIVQAYLSGSGSTTLIKDIHRLVLPYLGVLEGRRARAATPGAESTIPDALRAWALSQSNHLSMLEALINASLPTLNMPARLIKSNLDLARILIACFYTSPSVDEWERMGHMFECMPAFPDHIPSSDQFNSADYLHELLSTIEPGSNLWTPATTHRVYDALAQLDTGRLSSILDGLDDHLTTAEVLARWNVPVRLAELVTKFHHNKVSQQKLATRIARQEGGIEMESEEEWEVLLEAMIELSQRGRALDLLDKTEVTKLFFSGLLTSGKFKLAKSLFSSSVPDSLLDSATQEELVIAASREFYDNSDTANLHKGEMKMAYDCLTVAPQTLNIKREREFIEASSRLASFKLESQPGIPMSPIEIRLKPNKLDLISRVLDTSPTAYQHQDMLIDMVNKLGYGEDLLVQIQALSMVVDCAVGRRDLLAASTACERMMTTLERIKKKRLENSESRAEKAAQVTWMACEKIGKCSGVIATKDKSSGPGGLKTRFLAHAITICPADQIPRLLVDWKTVEEEEEEDERLSKVARSQEAESGVQRSLWRSIELQKSKSDSGPAAGPSTIAGNLGIPGSDLASQTLERAVSLFPFGSRTGSGPLSSTHVHPSPPTSEQLEPSKPEHSAHLARARDFSQPLAPLLDLHDSAQPRFAVNIGTDRLTAALSNKFTSGVGWLIGASEDDLAS